MSKTETPANAPQAAAAEAFLPKPPGGQGLEAVFRPRSIAVIGASRDRSTVGGALFHNLLKHDFQGPIYPVNPKSAVVQSVRAYPSISDVPDAVDLVIMVVPGKFVNATLEECGKKGVKAAVVISAGFKEIGGEGIVREREMVQIARRYGMRVIGPNCLGVLNTEAGVSMDATFAPQYPPPGPIAFSSQSGALGLAILEYATALNIGISHFVSVGNKADVSGNDLLEFWERDENTRMVLLYLESFGNPRRFLEIARRVGRTKPIVAVKSGRTAAGMRAASSHTGSLAGADSAVTALCHQAGVIRTDTMEEMFDVAMVLVNQPVPTGNRVGIITNAGGPAIMASDACESNGLEVATLTDETRKALQAFLPAEASTRNPVDMIASATAESFEKAVRIVANDPNVDSLIVLYVPPIVTNPLEIAQAIVRGNEEAKADRAAAGLGPKPVLSCFLGSHGVPEGLRSLQAGHIPSYTFPEAAAIALARAVKYGQWLQSPDGKVPEFTDVDRGATRQLVDQALARGAAGDGSSWLTPDEVAWLLAAWRITTPAIAFARSADEAVTSAERLGFPVAVKLASDTLTHKSDVGGVRLDLRNSKDVRDAFTAIEKKLVELGKRDQMQGVTVQPMIREGIETIVGMTRDPSFGPLILFGLGGVQVELLKDVALRVHPLTDKDAAEMVRAIRGAKLLDGYRGAPPGDVARLQEVILRLSQLVGEFPEIAEMDLNPLKVQAPGKGCVALDARVLVRPVAKK
ncbi:MAG: acetate--CoA ligase family protein [Candidatus Eisenbacteria bacterium]